MIIEKNRKLIVNIYRYSKFILLGLVISALPILGYLGLYEIQDSSTLMTIGSILMAAGGLLLALFGLISIIFNKAVFTHEGLEYRTLLKKINVKYSDIINVESYTVTRKKRGSIFPSVQYLYVIVCKDGKHELDSFEFLGIGKTIDQLGDKIKCM